MQTHRLQSDLDRITRACHHDPFAVLGKHTENGEDLIRVYLPDVAEVAIAEGNLPLERIPFYATRAIIARTGASARNTGDIQPAHHATSEPQQSQQRFLSV